MGWIGTDQSRLTIDQPLLIWERIVFQFEFFWLHFSIVFPNNYQLRKYWGSFPLISKRRRMGWEESLRRIFSYEDIWLELDRAKFIRSKILVLIEQITWEIDSQRKIEFRSPSLNSRTFNRFSLTFAKFAGSSSASNLFCFWLRLQEVVKIFWRVK